MSKHQIQPEYGNEQVDAGRKYRNPSHETKFSGANGDREIFISPVQLTSSRIGNLIRLIIILLYMVRSTVVQYGLLSVLGTSRTQAIYLYYYIAFLAELATTSIVLQYYRYNIRCLLATSLAADENHFRCFTSCTSSKKNSYGMPKCLQKFLYSGF